MRSFVTPQAAADLRAAVRYHESEQLGLGDRFLADYRATRRFVDTFPEGAPEVPGLGSRRKLFGRFRFSLFYAVREDAWSEANSGDTYKYKMSAQFADGFAYDLLGEIDEPDAPDDYDAGCIDLQF